MVSEQQFMERREPSLCRTEGALVYCAPAFARRHVCKAEREEFFEALLIPDIWFPHGELGVELWMRLVIRVAVEVNAGVARAVMIFEENVDSSGAYGGVDSGYD